jgi:hypothetical protein
VLDYVDAQLDVPAGVPVGVQESCGEISRSRPSRSVPCLVVSRVREEPPGSSGAQLDSSGAQLRFHVHPLWSSALGAEQSAYMAALLSDWQDDTLNQDDLFDHLASLSVGPLRFSRSGTCQEDELVHVVDGTLTRPAGGPSGL